jgi:hypothetical protein
MEDFRHRPPPLFAPSQCCRYGAHNKASWQRPDHLVLDGILPRGFFCSLQFQAFLNKQRRALAGRVSIHHCSPPTSSTQALRRHARALPVRRTPDRRTNRCDAGQVGMHAAEWGSGGGLRQQEQVSQVRLLHCKPFNFVCGTEIGPPTLLQAPHLCH